MTDTTSKYHSLLQQQQQQHSMHPLATGFQHHSSSGRPNTHGSTHHDSIDFTNNDALFISPLGPTSPLEDFEDLDYQSGFASYQKQHMVSRHTSLPGPNAMDIGVNTPSSNIPIHPIKQGTSPTSSFYTGDYDAFPMSAPAATMGHFGASSPPIPQYLAGGIPTTSTSTSSIYIHPQQPYQQQQQQQPKSMDSPGSAARSFEDDDYTQQMSMQMMMDKRRRRRESHNAVERRRRENINERIQELGTLLPETMTDTGLNSSSNKQNKGAILRHSVEHIRHLQQEVHSYSQRVKELEAALAKLQSK
ncbi:helix-loop-helix DNA-binding domain-containing protein [Chlamydoabsidia padenii]|nr:helix-loop-helix DNA-binding domain-containing protein [Chlamydoabsidia padenii]